MAAKLRPEKPKAITVLSVGRTRRFIDILYMKGDEKFMVQSKDNPLPAFSRALDALAPLVGVICEAPEKWTTNLRVMGITLSMMRDAKTVRVHLQKSLALSLTVLHFQTPPVLLSTPSTEGPVVTPLSPAQADLIHEVVEQAKRYIRNERAQGVMDFGDDGDEDMGEDEPLPLFEDTVSSPPRRPRSSG